MKIYAETDRLILREMLPDDVNGMFELDSDPLVHKYLGNKPIQTIEESKKMITYVRDQYVNQGVGRWSVIEKATGDFMGWSGLKFYFDYTLNSKTHFYDIGYRLIPRYWGKGYATESAIAAMDYGFNNLKLDTIVGLAEVENIGSNKILKKIGLKYIEVFAHEGEKVNWYELKKEDYAKDMS